MRIPKGKYSFELWRIYSSIKILIKSIFRVPLALISNEQLRKLALADEVYIHDGELYIEEFRDGWCLRGPNTIQVRIDMIKKLLRERTHNASRVIRSALRHLKKDLISGKEE